MQAEVTVSANEKRIQTLDTLSATEHHYKETFTVHLLEDICCLSTFWNGFEYTCALNSCLLGKNEICYEKIPMDL